MEQFWQSAFAWFFFPLCVNNNHIWTLQPISSPPAVANEWPWHSISYSAKVRFQCPVSEHNSVEKSVAILIVCFIVVVQTWLDIDERSCRVLVITECLLLFSSQ